MSKRLTSAFAAAAFAVAAFAVAPASAAPAAQIAPAVQTAVADTAKLIEVRDRRNHRAHRWDRRHRGWHRGRHHGPRWGQHRWRRNCIQTVRVWTPWGHQWRRVNVCR